jgi:hypothetical protein
MLRRSCSTYLFSGTTKHKLKFAELGLDQELVGQQAAALVETARAKELAKHFAA